MMQLNSVQSEIHSYQSVNQKIQSRNQVVPGLHWAGQ